MASRLYKPPGGKRPSQCDERSDQSTFVPLITADGDAEIMVMGGCYGDTLHSLDVYSVRDDAWKTVDTVVARGVPASILLPDGRVLLISGENTGTSGAPAFASDDAITDLLARYCRHSPCLAAMCLMMAGNARAASLPYLPRYPPFPLPLPPHPPKNP